MTDEETKPSIQRRTEYRWSVSLGQWGWAYVTRDAGADEGELVYCPSGEHHLSVTGRLTKARVSALLDILRSAFPEAL